MIRRTCRDECNAERNRTHRFEDEDEGGTLNSGDTNVTVYRWDHRNRLVGVKDYATFTTYQSDTPTQEIEYYYDHQNRWVRKLIDPDGPGGNPVENTIFVYDGNQIVLQFDNTGTGDAAAGDLSHRYLWGPAVDQVLVDEQVSSLSTPGARYWPLSDHLGSVRDVIDDTATVQLHRIYDAFGNIIGNPDPANIAHLFAFTARPLDEDSGLQNNLNRWYDLSTGRWMSEDPIGFGAFDVNLYRYVHNDSLRLADPSGLIDWWGVADTVFAVFEGTATFVTGAADSFTMGGTKIARERMWGTQHSHIHYTGLYKAGEYTEVAAEIALTGGSAVLKKAAAKKITKEAAELAAKEVGEELTEQAAKQAVKKAKDRIKKRLRKEARKIADATDDAIVHHIHTLGGHPYYPGGALGPSRPAVQSAFPSLGYRWAANNKKNLMTISKSDRFKHLTLHQRAYIAERLVITTTKPVLTGGRTVLNLQRDNFIDIRIDVRNCLK